MNLNPDYSTHRLYSYAAAGYGLKAYARDLSPDKLACLAGEKEVAAFEADFCLCSEKTYTYRKYSETSDGFSFWEDACELKPAELFLHSLSEAEESFASEDSWISYGSGCLCIFKNETKEADFISAKISELKEHPEETELYLSDYYGNNQGDLCCVFDEWWLQNHREYLSGLNNLPLSLTREVGDFRVSGNQTIVGVNGYIRKTATYVTIPDYIRRIGERAFAGCENLMAIAIPDSVTEIGAGAFYGCASLEIIKIPSSVKTIREETFAHCTSLKKVILPDSLTSIEKHAFYRCRCLYDISVTPDIQVDETAFDLCSHDSQTIALICPEDLICPAEIREETVSGLLKMLKKVMPPEYNFTVCTDMIGACYESDIQILVIDASLLIDESDDINGEDDDYYEDFSWNVNIISSDIVEMFGVYHAPAFMFLDIDLSDADLEAEQLTRDYLENFVPEVASNHGLDEEINDKLYDVVFFSVKTGNTFTNWYHTKTDLMEFVKNLRPGLKEEYDKLFFKLDPEKDPLEYCDFFDGDDDEDYDE
ncbi:MAG: leucine-rich repeat domain-containing protein [Clostridiales bacterium]|nr:leucine-rich repeat domain-containing protein [Clostridiales bacterium]